MDHLKRQRGALVAGMVLLAVLAAGCGTQTSQSAQALSRLGFAPQTVRFTPFGVLSEPSVNVAPRPILSIEQLHSFDRIEANRVVQATQLRQALTQTQATTQAPAMHHCLGSDL